MWKALLYLRNEGARSDQCEKCGNELEAEKLINPRSKVDGSTPILKETEHFFLDLSTLEPKIQQFLKEREDYGDQMSCVSPWERSNRLD